MYGYLTMIIEVDTPGSTDVVSAFALLIQVQTNSIAAIFVGQWMSIFLSPVP